MKITKVDIRNFRALKHISVPLQKFSVILGENDAGKTSLLYAIEKFFAHKKLDSKDDWHQKNSDSPIEITLSFNEVSALGTETFAREGIATIKAEFAFNTSPIYKAILDNDKEQKLSPALVKQHFSDDNFSFVPVNRNITDHFSTGKTTLLGKMMRQRMYQILEDGDLTKKTIHELEKAFLLSVEEPRAKIQNLLREQLKNSSINLSFDEFAIDPLANFSLNPQLSDDKSQGIDIQNRGAGTQNNLIIALFRFIAQSDMGGNFILGLEEPENSLHPKAQRQLLSAIQDISAKTQVLITTHSPVFIDRVHYENNIMLSRIKNGSTVARTFSQDSFPNVGEELGIRASDALLKGGGNCALLVEGRTEEEGFPIFMEMVGINEAELGISIINMGGSDLPKSRAIIELLGCYGIPCIVVLDNDAEKTQKSLEKMQTNKALPNLKKVFLHEGVMEDYYPDCIIAQVINAQLHPEIPVKEEDIHFSGQGKDRLTHISGVLGTHKTKGIAFLKTQLGSYGTKLMKDQKLPVDCRIQKILECARDIATRDEHNDTL